MALRPASFRGCQDRQEFSFFAADGSICEELRGPVISILAEGSIEAVGKRPGDVFGERPGACFYIDLSGHAG